MSRGWRPILAGLAVAAGVFLLAQWPLFEPEADAPAAGGATAQGAAVFAAECAGCHGEGGTGGIGPALGGSGLDAVDVAAAIDSGPGAMPAGLVTGPDQEEVVAYVVSIAG
jgi:mono/diheme cytochrome c family protein